MAEIVLDKSYLDGAATPAIRDLCERHTVLMPQELFFELLTTDPRSQRFCFAKLPLRDNPVALIPPVGVLLDFEREHHEACGPLSRHRVDRDPYSFNPGLRDGIFVPSTEDATNCTAWQRQMEADTRRFMETCLRVDDVFHSLRGVRNAELDVTVATVRETIATNGEFIRSMYGAAAPADAPSPHRVDSQWASFRVFQCRMLVAVRMYARYRGAIPRDIGSPFWTRAEHSMLDTYCLILGCLAGGLATLDDEIGDDFLLLCPDSSPAAPGVFLAGHSSPHAAEHQA